MPGSRQILDDIQQKFGFGQQHTLEKGLKKFGDQGVQATEKEIGKLHDRECFRPVRINKMSHEERRKAQIALAYLSEK